MNNCISWHYVDIPSLPSLIFDPKSNYGNGNCVLDELEIRNGRIGVGYRFNSNNLDPCLILVQNSRVTDLLAWLRVYSDNTFPISNLIRLITLEDWRLCNSSDNKASLVTRERAEWASLVLGELLAQGDLSRENGSISLARSRNCFSLTVAQSHILYGTESVVYLCMERLRELEKDRCFFRRQVTVDMLRPLWKSIIEKPKNELSLENIVVMALESLPKVDTSSSFHPEILLSDYPELKSDSIETRVVAFERISKTFFNFPDSFREEPKSLATVAAAAFLVGRGTSHVKLLLRLAHGFPRMLLYFGWLASLAGQRYWDPFWWRMARGVNKIILQDVNWYEYSLTDLSWIEFDYLKLSKGKESLVDMLPKLSSTALSIEIVPGANCQLRLANSGIAKAGTADNEKRNYRIQEALHRMAELGTYVQSLIHSQDKEQGLHQTALRLDSGATISRQKRPKKGSL